MRKFIQQYRRPLRLAAAVLLCLLIAAVGYELSSFVPGTQPVTSKPPVNVTAVQLGTINKPIRIIRAGSIEKATFTAINAEVSGRISEIYVREGQSVKAGQALLKLEASAPAVDNENSNGGQASPKTVVPRPIQDSYDNALKEYNRCQKLYEQGAIPRKQLESAMARLQEVQKSMSNGQSASSAPTQNSVAKVFSGPITLKAPIDGIVTGIVAPGKTVQAGQQLMAMGSGQELEFIASLEQNDLYLVHLGTRVTIQAADQTILGQVSSIYPEIQDNKIASFMAHIKLTGNSEGSLKPGMSANIQIDTNQSTPVPAVPKAVVWQDEQGQNFIFTAVDGKAVRTQVSVGETIGDFIEITSSIPQETIIITSDNNEINNGDPIAILR